MKGTYSLAPSALPLYCRKQSTHACVVQIACFVLPVVVLVGWILGPVPGHSSFTLDFDAFITLLLTLAVIHAYFVSSDGTSNWLAGVQLCTTYILIALLYLFIKDSPDQPPPAS